MTVVVIVKNSSQSAITIQGVEIAVGAQYSVPFANLFDWTFDTTLIGYIQNGTVTLNDGANDYIGDNALHFLLSVRPKFVITASEKDDIDLKLASDEQSFVGNICTLSLKIPGTLGQVGARKIGGGYGFTDVFGWGDRVTKVELVDKDYVYAGILYPSEPEPNVTWAQAMPDGVVLGSYVDDEQDAHRQGWRLWCDDGGQGGVDIDPLGGLAKLLALCYLVVTIEKTQASTASKAALNAWWAKPSL